MASQPGKWDYTLAGVPSPLTDELESQQLAKQVSCSNLTSPVVASLISSYFQQQQQQQQHVDNTYQLATCVVLVCSCAAHWFSLVKHQKELSQLTV